MHHASRHLQHHNTIRSTSSSSWQGRHSSSSRSSGGSCGTRTRHTLANAARRNYYEVLQIAEEAGQEEIRAAFRRLAKRVHPDINRSPDADKQFRLLRLAHDVLLDAQLRGAHDAELGLSSARSRDPRFARFERWRREVLPDLEEQLVVWTEEIRSIIAETERQLAAQQAVLQAVLAAQQGSCGGGEPAVLLLVQQGPVAGATAAAGAGSGGPVLVLVQQRGDGDASAQQQDQQQHVAWRDADKQQRRAAAGTALSRMRDQLADAAGNVRRLHDKRYQQVEGRYAYPAIVWYDMWTEWSDDWLNELVALEGRWQPEVDATAAALQECGLLP